MCHVETSRRRGHDWAAWLDTALILAGLGLYLALPRTVASDGEVRYGVLSGLVDHGRIPAEPYSLVTPLLASPLYGLGKLAGAAMAVTYRYNGLLLAAGLLAGWLLLRDLVDRDLLRTLLLLLVYASMLPAHVTSFYGEVTTAVLVMVGLLAAVAARRGRRWGWAAVVLGVVNTPASLVGLGLVSAVRTLRTARWRYLLLVPAAVAVIVVDVTLHTGHPGIYAYAGNHGERTVLPYSGRSDFSYPFFFGLLSITLSFGKGLFFFAPGLLLPVRRLLRRTEPALETTYLLWLAFLVGLVLVYARWWAWYGGFYWGPRFFLVASFPAALAIAVRLRDRTAGLAPQLLTLAALGLSSLVAVSAALGNTGQDICLADNYALEHLCWYTPEFSVLWHPFVEAPRPDPAQLLFLVLTVIVFVRLALPLIRGVARPVLDALAAPLRRRSWQF